MLKKTVFASVAALLISSPAMAIEKSGEVGFNGKSTGYASCSFNRILTEGYGLNFSNDFIGAVPAPYVKDVDGEAVFNQSFKAYTPKKYDTIFNAYGLKLSPMKVQELGFSRYASVVDGEIVFSKEEVAFNGAEWEAILGAYELAAVPMTPPAPEMPSDSDGDGVIDSKDQCPGTPKGVVVDERGCWVLSSGLLFDYDSATIKTDFYPVLNDTKKVFDAYPLLKVTVEGHADSRGSDAYNQKLSEKRANAVVNYLVNMGVAEYRLDAMGYGEMKPAYSNDTEMGRAKNRRVEFSPMR